MPILTVPVAGQYGVILDQQAQELPVNAWSRAINMRFKDGCAERVQGESQIFTTPSVIPYYMDAYQSGNSRYFIHAGIARVFADDGTTRTDITPAGPFTGAIDDRWNGGVLGGVLVMNNTKQAPVYWGGTGVLAPITGWPAATTAAVVRPWKNILVALDITEAGTRYPMMIRSSSLASPGTIPTSWDYTDPTSSSLRQDLAEETSQMVDCMPWGNANFIYKERAVYAMTIGGPLGYTFTKLPGNEGMLARGCVATTPRGHVVLTAGDVVLQNGQGPESIIDARNRRTLFNTIDATNYKRSVVFANPGKNEVWVCIPVAGDSFPTLAYVWNYKDDTWTTRELDALTYGAVGQLSPTATTSWDVTPGTWDAATEGWNTASYPPTAARLLTSSANSRVSLVDKGGTFNGTAYTSVLERRALVVGEPSRVKVINAIEPRFDAPAGTQIKIEVGASFDAELLPTYSPPVTYTVGSSYRAFTFASGKFPAIRFTSLDNQPWKLKSYDIHYTDAGLW